MKVVRYCMLIVLYHYSFSLNAARLPSISMPSFIMADGMNSQWVAKNFFYNGYPMTIQKFTSSKLSEDLLAFYKNKWRSSGYGIQEVGLIGEAYNIGYEENEYSFSIQAENTSYGSLGTLVVTKNKQYDLGPSMIPVHSDNKVLSRMHSLDNAVLSETLIINSLNSISLNQRWYDTLLASDGWKLQSHYEDLSSAVVIYQNNNRQCQITYADANHAPGNKVVIMIHCIQGIT